MYINSSKTTAEDTQATAGTITTAGIQKKPTAAITSATTVSEATAEAAGLLWDDSKSRDVSSSVASNKTAATAETLSKPLKPGTPGNK
jgi:hypothetical protein